MHKQTIAVFSESPRLHVQAHELACVLQVPCLTHFTQDFPVLLIFSEAGLRIQLTADDAPGPVFVDFLSGVLAHRRQYGGGKGQLIAKAVGVKGKWFPSVLDVTAGLGRDAFVLALLGCQVTMCERSKVVHALLADGLQRAQEAPWFKALSLSLLSDDALCVLDEIKLDNRPDVIYCDPMFPDKAKTALVKKEMRVLRAVVGDDLDSGLLLEKSLLVAKKRVVVKRAKLAPAINDCPPDLIFRGKSSRYDVYFSG